MNIVRTQTDKLVVGTNDVSYFPPDISPTGTAVLNGPVYIGQPTAALAGGAYQGALNVGVNPALQNALDLQPPYLSTLAIKADGNLTVDGDSKTPNALLISGGSSDDTVHIVGDLFVSGRIDGGNKGRLASRFQTADEKGKVFDMPHPSRDGYRLRYACIEGPEIGVYCRGRLNTGTEIELPSHWKDLVHENSITVQITPIGSQQNIIVKEYNNEKIVLESDGNIDCFYMICGERKDVNPLITEYEGKQTDYPDPNWRKTIDDETRDLKDPQYNFGQNVTTK
tara:strand:- start:31 stop:876 length:846 start_codon:yes stop_codon:yes gene_type:complete